jgi:hypothetical protein
MRRTGLLERNRRGILGAMVTCTAGLTAIGCLEQNVTQVERPVQPRTVALRVIVDSAGQPAAQALAWSGGVPDVDVTVASEDSAQTIVAAGRTDATGTVQVGPLEPASYEVSFTRLLSASERDRLASTGAGGVEGFARRARVRLGGFDTASVVARASLRGSLLMSEWAFFQGYDGHDSYVTGGFLELYNNSDTTVFLDSLVIGAGFFQEIAYVYRDCGDAAALYLPANGVWVGEFNRFPGRGKDYPVAPGHVVVIATDAIDHRPFFPNALDLRHADFEFTGPSDVDNPVVPNLTMLGPLVIPPGHGEAFTFGNGGVVLVLRPLNTDTLGRTIAAGNHEYRFVQASAIIDASVLVFHNFYGFQPCEHVVNPAIDLDHALGGYGADPFQISMHRRVLYEEAVGRKVLMNTRSSRTDFVDGPRTPGVVP